MKAIEHIILSDEERKYLVTRLSDRIEKIGECEIWRGTRDVLFRRRKICTFRVYSYIHNIHMKYRARLNPTCGNKHCVSKGHMRFRSSPRNKGELLAWLQDGAIENGECLVRVDLTPEPSGYVKIEYLGRSVRLHRAVYWCTSAYEHLKDIPKDMVVAHLCRNKACCNPKHYELVTHSVNSGEHRMRDGTDFNGEKSSRAKITLLQAQKIADSWSLELKVQERADMFGVTSGMVSAIDRRITWKDVIHPNGKKFTAGKPPKKEKRVCYSTEELQHIRSALEKGSIKVTSKHMSDDCWEWQKGKQHGRPYLCIFGRCKLAYRYAALLSSGGNAMDDTKFALHSCGNQTCVNPSHVRWGTHMENVADSALHGTNSQKLTAEDVRRIREIYQTSGKSYAQIAKDFGVHYISISKIVRRLIWKHVP